MLHVQNNIHVVFFAVAKNNIFALFLYLRKHCRLPSTPGASGELTVVFPA